MEKKKPKFIIKIIIKEENHKMKKIMVSKNQIVKMSQKKIVNMIQKKIQNYLIVLLSKVLMMLQ